MERKKEKYSILMYPANMERIDSLYELHGYTSRSEFLSEAAEFYLGFLESGKHEKYMERTMLAFLEDKLAKLEARICRQLFRMCVEIAVSSHVSASQIPGVDDETMKIIRQKCVKAVKNTIGNIRFDPIYDYQHEERFMDEERD